MYRGQDILQEVYLKHMATVKIYTSPSCPYCILAKNLFASLDVAYEECNVWEHPEEADRLSAEHNWTTVPMIFINEKFVGGYDDVAALHSAGKLKEMLA